MSFATFLVMLRSLCARMRETARAHLHRRMHGAAQRYRPEFHYMRGPGPKWREKHGVGLGASRRGAVE
jgi:hypothetical protein